MGHYGCPEQVCALDLHSIHVVVVILLATVKMYWIVEGKWGSYGRWNETPKASTSSHALFPPFGSTTTPAVLFLAHLFTRSVCDTHPRIA